MGKKLLKDLGINLLVIVVAAGGLVVFLTATEYKPAAVEFLDARTLGVPETPGDSVRIVTWNVGYCGLGAEEDFVMDGGSGDGRPEMETFYAYYEGVLSDVRSIAELCHARGVTLLVDEAHGAHYLPFAAQYGWQGGAVAAGADLVVQSAHKTLPSLTQTAFLQLNGDLADPAEVERQLDVFETSSPSYPLMVSLDGCTRWLADEGEAAFAAWRTRLDAFDAAVRDLKNTKILCCGADALTAHPDFFAHDSGKILLQIGAAGAAYLRADGFEPEMVCGPNVLAMTSPCDDADARERLADVLHAGDKTAAPPAAPRHILPAPGAARCTIAEALLRPARAVRMRDAVGESAAEYLWAYPPGVPLVAPGEEVTAELVTACRALEQAGTALKHTGGSGAEEIAVLL